MFFSLKLLGGEDEDETKTVKIGNFSVPSSQQPAPLIGFGERLVNADQLQFQFGIEAFKGHHSSSMELFPAILYGIRDDLSLFINLPYVTERKTYDLTSENFDDLFIGFEYAFYNSTKKYYSNQATFVAAAFIPVNFEQTIPQIGNPHPSVFLGFTYAYMSVDWFYFTAIGFDLNERFHRDLQANNYLYQFGIGKNIAYTKNWIFSWMFEIDGTYSEKNIFQGLVNPNSGGNVIFATPSIFLASEHFIAQAGVGHTLQQHLFGNQPRNDYIFAIILSCTH